MDAKIIGMIESDYEGMTLYVTALRVGAVALVLDKSVNPNELRVGTVAEIVKFPDRSYDFLAEEILCGPYDATGEFVTDYDIAYVGINFNHDGDDRDIVAETLDHIRGGYYIADDPEGYADSGESPHEVFAEQIRKYSHEVKRDRKIDDNRRHYAEVCAKKGAVV